MHLFDVNHVLNTCRLSTLVAEDDGSGHEYVTVELKEDEIVSRLRIRSLGAANGPIQQGRSNSVKGWRSAYDSGPDLVANFTYHCAARNSEGYAEQTTVIAVKGIQH